MVVAAGCVIFGFLSFLKSLFYTGIEATTKRYGGSILFEQTGKLARAFADIGDCTGKDCVKSFPVREGCNRKHRQRKRTGERFLTKMQVSIPKRMVSKCQATHFPSLSSILAHPNMFPLH